MISVKELRSGGVIVPAKFERAVLNAEGLGRTFCRVRNEGVPVRIKEELKRLGYTVDVELLWKSGDDCMYEFTLNW